mmetsp:Transcript_27828/g.56966  ORF Transcript_27828/g.56966 Transcript_27828/m.56966 type:complete len:233 (+) Transcript_27828:183-881(+)|eukprot:CAMPEP_0181324432 /NCGR_PEP_ID=MMETSP1101-20121128/20356_1 /TAXON_ID=46948 /ORGANISM="Rhodomonas abbreviata, Strain Caron Lab Isolate" /LENGTH=232 /DNA_ID=CAMNT_0023432607 /DNA_START=183 /DNA_END=881 /DNA_ORIENTATION=-
METIQSLFSGLACCSNLQEQQEIKSQESEASFLITCFDEHDMELRDIKVHPTTSWAEMQICVTDALGTQAMFAYDDGTAIDLPVRTEKEWRRFLDMLKSDQTINGEYDILLLPAGDWNRYDQKQKEAAANGKLSIPPSGKSKGDVSTPEKKSKEINKEVKAEAVVDELGPDETGDICSAVASLAKDNLLSSEDEKKVYDLIAVSHAGVVKAYREYQESQDMTGFSASVKGCL